MPTYLLHGFRWPRQSVHIHVILHRLDDAAANWTMAPQTTKTLLEDFISSFPDPMEELPNLRFVEEYDPQDPLTKHSPYAYVADIVQEIRLSYAVNDMIHAAAEAVPDSQLEALTKLRDELCPDAKIEWYIVVCGDLERDFPAAPTTPPGADGASTPTQNKSFKLENSPVPKKQMSRRRLNSFGRRLDKEQSSDNLTRATSSAGPKQTRRSSDTQQRPTTSTHAGRQSSSNLKFDPNQASAASPAPLVSRTRESDLNGNEQSMAEYDQDKRQGRLKSAFKRIF